MEKYSFQNGINQVKSARKNVIRAKIMKALQLRSLAAYYARLNGVIEPKISEARAIEKIFSEEKPPIRQVWGIGEKIPTENNS